MLKKTIIKGKISETTTFEKTIEVFSPSGKSICTKIGSKRVNLTLEAAEMLANQLLSDVEFLRSKSSKG
ncbi:hypothetical protein [Hwangdonia seohaensis]|uniref:Uncharacterized protein n=1 Tax=Hwangdonia seohaensis TaxID=1240727 RepID=A0ABW3R9W6_9FLAO|nr:hypothetical protein [Hwangdonia seohaensis]